mmetsp:Transcript_1857/g.5468  ORF Transcript_1857/g.5468 Transcript_1857/m.5468 type:complete len:384 (-) Transcript_1857:390-1541(-)
MEGSTAEGENPERLGKRRAAVVDQEEAPLPGESHGAPGKRRRGVSANKIDQARFLRAQDRRFEGFGYAENSTWTKDFSFVQLADPQLGMLRMDKSWEEEQDMLKLAVEHINRLQPRFVVVCGDLVNAYPDNQKKQQAQAQDFKAISSEIDSHIPLVCVCGNHDVGNTPTQQSIDAYRERFGDDYFSFWVDGVKFIVLNTQLHKDDTASPDLLIAQDQWLDEEFAASEKEQPTHTIILSHIPPFIESPDEEDGYFNLETLRRRQLLRRVKRARVSSWFCGHYHRNAGGMDGPLEVVVSSAVGCILKPNGKDPLGLGGFQIPPVIGPGLSGLRIVDVSRQSVKHKWFTLDSVPPPKEQVGAEKEAAAKPSAAATPEGSTTTSIAE